MLNKPKIKGYLLTIIFLILNILLAFSQELNSYSFGLPYIENYFNINDPNQSSTVNDIIQLPNGKILAASNSGILLFDGSNWNKIIDGEFLSLGYDKKHKILYTGRNSDFGYITFDLATYSYKYEKLSILSPHIIKNTWQICSNGLSTYFLVDHRDIYIYDNKQLSYLELNNFKANRCFKLNDLNFLIVDDSSGLGLLSNSTLLKISTQYKNIYRQIITGFLPAKTPNNFWVFTSKGNFYKYDLINDKFLKIKTLKFLGDAKVIQVTQLSSNRIILLTNNSGLFLIDTLGNLYTHIEKNHGLITNSIKKIYVDLYKTIWLGTNRFISRIYYSMPYRYITENLGYDGEVVSLAYFNKKLFLTTTSGIYYSDFKHNRFVALSSKYSFKYDNLTKIKYKGQEYLLTSSIWKTLLIDPQLKIHELKTLSHFFDFKQTKSGKIFALSSDSLIVFELDNFLRLKKLQSYYLPFLYTKQVAINDTTVILYSASNNTLIKLILNKKLDTPKKSILNIYDFSHIYSLLKLNDSTLLISTNYGLITYNINTQTYKQTPFEQLNSHYLSKEHAFALLPDTTGLWILTDKNLIYFNFVINDFKIFPIETKPHQLSYKLLKIQDLIVGTNKFGIFLVCSHDLTPITNKVKEQIFPIYLQINSHKYFIIENKGLIKRKKDSTWIIKKALPYNAVIKLKLGVISSYIPRVLYSYKVNDSKWTPWQSSSLLEFNRLKSGKSTVYIRVQSLVTRKIYNIKLKIKVKTYFFDTLWFKLLVFIITAIVLYRISRIISERERRRRVLLEKLVKKRTKELEEKNKLLEEQYKKLNELTQLLVQQKEELEAQNDRLSLANLELRQLSLVAQKTTNSVLILDKKGRLEWWNEGFTRLFKHKFNIEKTKNIRSLIREIRPDVYSHIQNFPASHKSVEYTTHEIIPETGEEIWYKTTITPVFDENGEIYRFVVLDVDITEIKQAEKKIKEQKNELERQTQILKKINKEIEQHRKQLEIHHKEMLSSLEYAKKIQAALLPRDEFQLIFPQNFIIDRPKEIVSGDFYYITVKNDKIIVSIADGTGHGVPGAFMSILGLTLLKDSIEKNEDNLSSAAILNTLRESIIKALHQTMFELNVKDGLDIALVIIDVKQKTLNFSGANIPAILIRDKEILIEMRPDRMPIGIHEFSNVPFKEETIDLYQYDRIYLHTDGYVDQFGGPDNKRFKRSRFKRMLLNIQHLDMKEQKRIIEQELDKWMGQNDQIDDITVLGFEIDFDHIAGIISSLDL